MGNIIRLNDDQPVEEWLSMSNGGTDALLDILGLAGTALAKTEREKQMIIWLVEKDSTYLGMGTIGFDIVKMPWTKAGFESERTFMLRVIDEAAKGLGWEKLDYVPNEELMMPRLERLRSFFEQMTVDMVDEENLREWIEIDKEYPEYYAIPDGYPVCEKHGMLKSYFGCRRCFEPKG